MQSPRVLVGAPARELGGVPEAHALHVVVAHLDDPLGPQRGEREVLAGRPPAAGGVLRGAGALLLAGPRPRVLVERRDQRLQLVEQLLAPGHREGPDDPHRQQLAVGVVDAEQQAADQVVTALVGAVAGDDAVGGALVLDLGHRALVGLVGAVELLGDEAVEPGPLELGEPLRRDGAVGRRRGEVDRAPARRPAPARAAPAARGTAAR